MATSFPVMPLQTWKLQLGACCLVPTVSIANAPDLNLFACYELLDFVRGPHCKCTARTSPSQCENVEKQTKSRAVVG